MVDMLIAQVQQRLVIDTGLYDDMGEVGFELVPSVYDGCVRAGKLTPLLTKVRRDASGRYVRLGCGIILAQLFDPTLNSGVGPAVKLLAARGAIGLPSRVGVEFFHRLAGCRVDWDLSARRWCVEYP
jgi:hypothetical protein